MIIPAFNREKTIERCMNSVIRSWKPKSTEIIIVDDGSSDNTIKLLQKYKKIKILRNKERLGAAYSRNKGILNSKGKYVLFVDSDVALNKNCIKKLFHEKKNFDIIYPTVRFEDKSIMTPITEKEMEYPCLSTVVMIKKESLKKLDELFDELYFIWAEDSDFFLRCRFVGLKAKYIKNAGATHLLPPTPIWRKHYFELKNHIYALIKFSFLPRNRSLEYYGFMASFKTICWLILMGLFNRDFREIWCIKKGGSLKKLFFSKVHNSRSFMFYSMLRALKWNFLNLKKVLEKRKRLKKYYGDFIRTEKLKGD